MAEEILYSDLDLSLSINPITKDIYTITNEQAVKQSLKNLIFTKFMDRKFNPLLGCSVNDLLFELPTLHTIYALKQEIETLIKNFEKRVILLTDIKVTYLENYDTYSIVIIFSIINNPEAQTLTVSLNRIT